MFRAMPKRFVLLAVLSLGSAAAGEQVLIETVEAQTPVEAPATTQPAATRPAADEPVSPEVASLVQQLADADPAKVESARQQLIAAGEPAKAALEQFIRPRFIAESVLAAIETNKVAPGTLITLKLEKTGIEAALTALAKQAGCPMRLQNRNMFRGRGEAPTVTADYVNQPFWDALRDLCQQAAIAPYNDGSNTRQMIFMPVMNLGNTPFNRPYSVNGAVLTTATNVSQSKSINFANPQPTSDNFNISFGILFEPKVRVMGYLYHPQVDEAIDDRGNSLIRKNSGNSGMGTINGSQQEISVSLQLMMPANAGTKIVRLRGKNRFNVITRTESIEFTDLTKEQTKKSPGGRRMTFTSVKPQNENAKNPAQQRFYHVQVVIHRDGMEQQKFHDIINNGPGMRLLDAAGREYRFQHMPANSMKDDQATLTLAFLRVGRNEGNEENTGDPAKLVWEYPIDSQEITVPFEFTDLPMP